MKANQLNEMSKRLSDCQSQVSFSTQSTQTFNCKKLKLSLNSDFIPFNWFTCFFGYEMQFLVL